MRGLVALGVVALLGGVARAEDPKVLVLRAEGRADKKARAKIEAGVLKLAKTTTESTTAGDITYGDAAAMVGCKPDEDKCKDEVLGMLAVDEIVTIAANPKPGGIDVAVRRITKGGATRSGNALVTPEQADQLDAIASLFSKAGPASPFPPPITTPPPLVNTTTTPPPATTTTTTTTPPTTDPNATIPPPSRVADMTPMSSNGTTVPTGPSDQRDDETPRKSRLPMIGMIGGGAMLLGGVIFWASAAGIEEDIKNAPKRTKDDLRHVQDLEAQGDAYATAGNVLTVAGLVLGGVSTYFFIRGRKQSSRTARITPVGGGAVITWGGSL